MKPIHSACLAALSLAGVLLACAPQPKLADETQPAVTEQKNIIITKSPKDTREYRYLELDNKMQVVLISDTNSQQSVASLSVGVGSYQDPEELPGLAHFLEHMLFLGTEKYPQPSGFFKFVEGHGGFSNAYTAKDHTNYYFSIQSTEFDAALDRFSDYFKAPNFNPEYLEKERTAVDNEWTKGRQQDGRIMQRVRGLTGNPAHPLSRMSVGNKQTLTDLPSGRLLDHVKSFYEQNYSANIMKLVVAGNQSLDELEALAKKHFSAIKNHQIERPHVAESGYSSEQPASKIFYQPQQQMRLLLLEFPIPDNHANWQHKSNSYIRNLLTSEDPGTLGDYLRKQNLAVSSTAYLAPGYYGPDGFAQIQIELTEQGLAQQDKIIAAVFAYIELIKNHGISESAYQELAAIAQDEFANRDNAGLMQTATHFSSAMFDYPAEHLNDAGKLFAGLDKQEVKKLLAHMTIDNLRLWIVDENAKVEHEIPYYKGRYDKQVISESEKLQWQRMAQSIKLQLPSENPYFSQQKNLNIKAEYLVPTQLYHQNNIDAWITHSKGFQDNQGWFELILNTGIGDQDAHLKVLSRVFLNMFNDHLIALRDKAGRAGIQINILPYWGGSLRIQLQGKSDKHPQLMQRILQELASFEPTSERFLQTLSDYKDELNNYALKTPAEQAGILLTQLSYQAFTYPQLLQASDYVKLNMIPAFKQTLLEQSHKMIFAYGAYNREHILTIVEQVKQIQGTQTKAIARYKNQLMPIYADNLLNFKEKISHTDTAVLEAYISPTASLKEALLLQVLNSRFKSAFFKQLRTEEQLGYQVASMAFDYDDHPVFAMLVQSNHATDSQLVQRYQAFVADFQKQLADMTEAEFNQLKQGVLSRYLQPPNSLYQEASPIVNDYIESKLSFDTRERSIKLLQEMKLSELKVLYQDLIVGDQRTRLLIQLRGQGQSQK
ncbi:insulinase family protein [Gayadomonas joobiniege]|uniref:insulinase family protein n=1 Tax=Gayadomonas joobiniege TaxID=1234606 RepID=UPI0003792F82|nr:insulinase family protein [Gayadomonas joobiniege]